MRDGVYTELLAQLFLLEAVDRTDLNHAVKALRDADILFFEFFAFLKLGIEEVDDPDLLPAIELENLAQIKLDDI